MEKIVLTVAINADVGSTEFVVWMFSMRRKHPDSPAEIRIIFREVVNGTFLLNGRYLTCLYSDTDTTTTTDDLIKQLNKVNLSAKSLERRLLERCQLDGKLGAGIISGTPD